jgi:hypothetical protein
VFPSPGKQYLPSSSLQFTLWCLKLNDFIFSPASFIVVKNYRQPKWLNVLNLNVHKGMDRLSMAYLLGEFSTAVTIKKLVGHRAPQVTPRNLKFNIKCKPQWSSFCKIWRTHTHKKTAFYGILERRGLLKSLDGWLLLCTTGLGTGNNENSNFTYNIQFQC